MMSRSQYFHSISPAPRTPQGVARHKTSLALINMSLPSVLLTLRQYPSWRRKTLPVICSTGKVGGLITVDDGVVRIAFGVSYPP